MILKMIIGTTFNLMYKQGEIVFVPFPYNEDLKISKDRPVVIVSKSVSIYNTYIVCKITSSIKNDNYTFPIFERDVETSLRSASEVRTNEIMTISGQLIRRAISRFKHDALNNLLNMVKDNF